MLSTVILLVGIPLATLLLAASLGALRWRRGTRALQGRLEDARTAPAPAAVDFRALEPLPAPVQRFFRRVLRDGQPIVLAARVRHAGTFDMGRKRPNWRPFTSDQRVVTERPGFDWDARIRALPGVVVRVHDAYVAGEGVLEAALFGLVPLARLRGGGELADGELMRFLAEAAWYPTVLLPGHGVTWQPVDVRSARATLRDGERSATLTFTFAEDGTIATVRADARGRAIGGRFEPAPWQGRFWGHAERNGMIVPLDGEVAWLLPDGERPYWRGRVTAIEHEFAT